MYLLLILSNDKILNNTHYIPKSKEKKSERDAKWNIYSKSQNIVVVIFITTDGYIMLYIEIDSYTIGKSMCLPI